MISRLGGDDVDVIRHHYDPILRFNDRYLCNPSQIIGKHSNVIGIKMEELFKDFRATG
ncbi:MAG: hypothetical protein V1862_13175 [Methanobacteriota archaeon]